MKTHWETTRADYDAMDAAERVDFFARASKSEDRREFAMWRTIRTALWFIEGSETASLVDALLHAAAERHCFADPPQPAIALESEA
jgi:hypothetical protein